ncbi:PE family protein [Mycobacterium ulcerans str. Harvey]|uniref:PE family protein n=1 Tax=Mycobacterium ulcerans str. Harvey TaxID=1299332 RepID=A0ABP3AL47_MYCUL|nr:PE family protein [Mycobacterium ulcerans str. Harvey]
MIDLLASPQAMTATATEVAEIGLAINQADLAVAGPTTGLAAAAADEVSEAIATLFDNYAQGYQAVSRQTAAFHDAFAQTLFAASDSYVRAEAAAVKALAGSPNQSRTCSRRCSAARKVWRHQRRRCCQGLL